MRNEDLYRMITDIDEDFILEAQTVKRKKGMIRPMMMIAAMFACVIGLLNFNPKVAYAMGEIPVVGNFFELITFRTFEYQQDTTYADVKIPKIKMEGLEVKYFDTITKLNHQIEEDAQVYIDQILTDQKGHKGLDISYDLIENDEKYLSIRLNILQTAASGYNQVRYYHIDKKLNQIITLEDLFKKEAPYIQVLSEAVKDYMNEKENLENGTIFFDNFKQIKENQNFYFMNKQTIVLVFDEYDITPGYYGVYEIPVKISALKEILK